jgi:hypothetical protein
MRVPRAAVMVVAGFLLASMPVSADEIVRFHDGRYLKVKGHSRTDRAIRLDFAGGAFVMCPTSRVDVIDRNGRIVFVGPRPDDAKPMVAERNEPVTDARDAELVADRGVGDARAQGL